MAANVHAPDVAFAQHIIPFAGTLTRNIENEIWGHVKTNLLLIPNNQHHYAVAFAGNGIRNFGDLLAMTVAQIDNLHYTPAGGGNPVPFLLGDCGRIKNVISMYNDISRMLDATFDVRTITRADLDTYRVGSYRPDQPLGCRHAHNVVVVIALRKRDRLLPNSSVVLSRRTRTITQSSTMRSSSITSVVPRNLSLALMVL